MQWISGRQDRIGNGGLIWWESGGGGIAAAWREEAVGGGGQTRPELTTALFPSDSSGFLLAPRWNHRSNIHIDIAEVKRQWSKAFKV